MNLKITHITDKVSLRMNLIRKKDKINKKQNRVKNGLYQLNDLSKCFVPLGGGPVVRVWDQEVCSLCGFRFEPCGCSYDGHWRLTWSLTSGPVGLVEVRASWPEHLR